MTSFSLTAALAEEHRAELRRQAHERRLVRAAKAEADRRPEVRASVTADQAAAAAACVTAA